MVKRLRTTFYLLVILAIAAAAWGWEPQTTWVKSIFSAEVVLASGTVTSEPIRVSDKLGLFSIQYSLTGIGAVDIDYLVSNDDITYVKPATATNIGSGLTVGDGFIEVFPDFCVFIKIRVTETTGNPVTITANLAVQ